MDAMEAIEILKARGWVMEDLMPGRAMGTCIVGPGIADKETGYTGFVDKQMGKGWSMADALEDALNKEERRIDRAIACDTFPNK